MEEHPDEFKAYISQREKERRPRSVDDAVARFISHLDDPRVRWKKGEPIPVRMRDSLDIILASIYDPQFDDDGGIRRAELTELYPGWQRLDFESLLEKLKTDHPEGQVSCCP